MDVLLRADLLEDLGPHGHADLAQMRRSKQVHVGPRLPDPSADAQRDLIVEDRLVIRKLQEVELAVSTSVVLRECVRCLRCDYREPENGNADE